MREFRDVIRVNVTPFVSTTARASSADVIMGAEGGATTHSDKDWPGFGGTALEIAILNRGDQPASGSSRNGHQVRQPLAHIAGIWILHCRAVVSLIGSKLRMNLDHAMRRETCAWRQD